MFCLFLVFLKLTDILGLSWLDTFFFSWVHHARAHMHTVHTLVSLSLYISIYSFSLCYILITFFCTVWRPARGVHVEQHELTCPKDSPGCLGRLCLSTREFNGWLVDFQWRWKAKNKFLWLVLCHPQVLWHCDIKWPFTLYIYLPLFPLSLFFIYRSLLTSWLQFAFLFIYLSPSPN